MIIYDYPESCAEKVWGIGNETLSLVHYDSGFDSEYSCRTWYCGYVRFAKKPVKEETYSGLLTYVPVHGGITYGQPEIDGSFVYGFDCNHLGDKHNSKLRDSKWLKEEVEKLRRGVIVVSKWEEFYLIAKNEEMKLEVIQAMLDDLEEELIISNNMGVMINLLCGRL
jgi:hypothetical protein